MSDDVKRTTVPRPAGPAPRGQFGGQDLIPAGRPPLLAAGEIGMTDYTRRQLGALGWKPGDAIPGDLSQEIAKIQARIAAEKETATDGLAVQGAAHPPRTGLIDITQLPEKDQRELRQYLADHKAEYEKVRALEAQVAEANARIDKDVAEGVVSPSVAASLRTMSQVQPPPGQPEIQIRDDRPAAPATPAATTAPAPAPVAAPAATGGEQPQHANCPRCLYSLASPLDPVPSDDDHKQFTTSLLGGAVFQKKYTFANGQFAVVFRGLTAKEVILVNKQLGADLRAGRIQGEGEYVTALQNYRLVLATHRLVSVGHILSDIPTRDAYMAEHQLKTDQLGTDGADGTILLAMQEDFYEKHITTETLRQLVGEAHREFQRLLGTLEARSRDRNFSSGIASPG